VFEHHVSSWPPSRACGRPGSGRPSPNFSNPNPARSPGARSTCTTCDKIHAVILSRIVTGPPVSEPNRLQTCDLGSDSG
jgi:hypothetical protein